MRIVHWTARFAMVSQLRIKVLDLCRRNPDNFLVIFVKEIFVRLERERGVRGNTVLLNAFQIEVKRRFILRIERKFGFLDHLRWLCEGQRLLLIWIILKGHHGLPWRRARS